LALRLPRRFGSSVPMDTISIGLFFGIRRQVRFDSERLGVDTG